MLFSGFFSEKVVNCLLVKLLMSQQLLSIDSLMQGVEWIGNMYKAYMYIHTANSYLRKWHTTRQLFCLHSITNGITLFVEL